jgi:hypothetical protein
MGGHPVPGKIPCAICNNPVDLGVDPSVDENGKAVHENCYVNQRGNSPHYFWLPTYRKLRNYASG